MNEYEGRMLTKIELALEQSQQGVINDILVAVTSSLRLLKPNAHKLSLEPIRDPIINLIRTLSMYNTCCSPYNNIWYQRVLRIFLENLPEHPSDTKVFTVKMKILLEPTSNKLLVEAEYVSLSACYAQVLWMRTQLIDYGFHFDKIPMYCDSKAAIAISCNLVQHSRTKHIDARYHFIKKKVEKVHNSVPNVLGQCTFQCAYPTYRREVFYHKVAICSSLRFLKPHMHKLRLEPIRDQIINLIRTQSMYNTCCSPYNNIWYQRVLRIFLENLQEHPSDMKVFTVKMEILLEPTSNKLLVGTKSVLQPRSSEVEFINHMLILKLSKSNKESSIGEISWLKENSTLGEIVSLEKSNKNVIGLNNVIDLPVNVSLVIVIDVIFINSVSFRISLPVRGVLTPEPDLLDVALDWILKMLPLSCSASTLVAVVAALSKLSSISSLTASSATLVQYLYCEAVLMNRSLIPAKSSLYYQAFNVKSLFREIDCPKKSQVKLKGQIKMIHIQRDLTTLKCHIKTHNQES
nr:ribonuclease H-like domain-containing protein [Tanacetum cinerariifolium]